MFNSETYGEIELKDIPEKLLTFYETHKNFSTPIQIVVGTDSQNHQDTKIVTVITICCEGKGGIFFYETSHIDKISDVRTKLYLETELSLKTADSLLAVIENDKRFEEMYLNTLFSIHVDAGHSDKGKTKELIPAIVGWIKSVGYDCKVKPDSFAASSIADKISK